MNVQTHNVETHANSPCQHASQRYPHTHQRCGTDTDAICAHPPSHITTSTPGLQNMHGNVCPDRVR